MQKFKIVASYVAECCSDSHMVFLMVSANDEAEAIDLAERFCQTQRYDAS